MSQAPIQIEIDGQTLSVQPGTMLIAAADAAGISIPRFCYHQKLSVAANCRMCLVDVARSHKPLPACATAVSEGMQVFTRSDKARAAQRDIMEFLLINHPLDCPICDQGGECELQDVAMGYGNARSHYAEIKRVVPDKDIGPLIETEMTRCIHCTRCVRFGDEIAGMRELGALGRGERMEIGTYIAESLRSELSGNVIDLCPVGALTAKPSRYTARSWELRAHPSIVPHDALGSNVELHSFDGRIVRAVPRDNEAVNECWLSDRDRFSYAGLYAADRLGQPEIKREGQWEVVSWQEAIEVTLELLRIADPDSSAALVAPTATVEEGFLLQKLMRGLGVQHLDHRLRQGDFSHFECQAGLPQLPMSLVEVEQLDVICLWGANTRHDIPLFNHRLRKASLAGANTLAINPSYVDYNFAVQQQVVAPQDWFKALLALTLALAEKVGFALPQALQVYADQLISEAARSMAAILSEAKNGLLVLGLMARQHPAFGAAQALAHFMGEQTSLKVIVLPEANGLGLSLAGVTPHCGLGGTSLERVGWSVDDILMQPLDTLILLHAELDDFNNVHQALTAFHKAKQVIAMTPFADEQTRAYATVLLPCTPFTETAGTFVNLMGHWQSFKGAAQPFQQARPAWKIFRVLGNSLGLPEFDYLSAEEVLAELKLDLQGLNAQTPAPLPAQFKLPAVGLNVEGEDLYRSGALNLYRSDAIVRRAPALQAMIATPQVRLNTADMQRLNLQNGDWVRLAQGEAAVQLLAEADDTVPVGAVDLASGLLASQGLGAAFAPIALSRV